MENLCRGSITTTNGIQISVEPEFIPAGDSNNEDNKYLFLYRIDIRNIGTETAHLLSRYWKIINAEGEVEEVKGSGVVGYSPILKPGDSFIYTSYCPLNTTWGTMEGYFSFLKADGSLFEATIDRFYLVCSEEQ